MQVKRIHHINFIVRDLDAAIERYRILFGDPVDSPEFLPQRGVKLARFRISETWVVLVQPIDPHGEPAKYLEQHGEGFFLMSLETDSLQGEVGRLGEAMFDGAERSGLDDWQVRDVDVAGMFGARLQLVESGGS